MKILQINAVNGIGSTGRTTREIDLYLKKRKHESIVAYSEGCSSENSYKIGNLIEKKMHALLSRLFGLQGYFSRNGTKNLIKYIKKENPDVIRLGNLHANYINIPMLLKFIYKNNIPTIITLDDCFFFTGKCTHYTEEGCYKWQYGCNKCPKLREDNPSWFLDRTHKAWSDKKKMYSKIPILGVVGVSEWITNEARKSILSSATYLETIYNWVDLDTFKPIDSNKIKEQLLIQDKFVILGVASEWSDSKGLNYFIDISSKLSKDELIVLVGDIPIGINLPKNIINIDRTHNVEELVEYYSMADVFLQLSLEETFGKVTAEALACGTPVVVFDSTANSELVGKKCGYMVKPSESNDIYKYIKKIKNNSKKYYSSTCRRFAVENFNKDEKILEYIKLCENLIKHKGEL